MKKNPYNPTPQSPVQVENNPDYELMGDYQSDTYYPSGADCIARHKASNTFWKTVYAVREDDSDADCSANWRQVVPEQVTITKYKDLK